MIDSKNRYRGNESTASRPKIAVVIPRYGRIGGAENMAFQLCERFADHFDIHVFARKWDAAPSRVTFHKVPMIHFPKWLQPISFAAFADRKIAGIPFDLIHSHERIFRMDILTFHGIPHRTWIHDMRKKSLSGFDIATCWAEQKGIQNPALKRILPVSTLVESELKRCYAIADDRVSVVNPGVDFDRFARMDAASCRNRIRSQHGLLASDTVICFAGMNFEIKRLDLVIQGMAGMQSRGISPSLPKLLIIGKGNKSLYQKMADDLGIGNRIIFAGVTNEIEAYYPACDFFVMPSVMDTFGLVVLEAMAAGLPVIISPTVGACDVVVHGENGLILPTHPSVQDMTDALIQLMNPDTRHAMGESARKTAAAHDWDKMAGIMADIYRNIIAAQKIARDGFPVRR